jgi:uncharacterized protein (TIGR03905 family)
MRETIVILVALSSLCLLSCNNHCNNQQNINNENALIQEEMITKDLMFIPEGVCSQQIDISVVNDTIRSVIFTKGCPGNTFAVAQLVEGLFIDDAIAKLDGITCKENSTSCPDQLAKALKTMK